MTNISMLLLILFGACAFGLSYLLYPKFYKDKTQRILAIFRFLSFLCLGFLLINPQIDTTSYKLEKPRLVFAFDDSKSIEKLAEPNEINGFLSRLEVNDQLNEAYSIDYLKFGSEVTLVEDKLSFTSKSTDISKPIDYLNTLEEEQVTTVLVTDGNQTLGEDYNLKSFRTGLNANILVVGDTTRYKDTKIDIVNANNYVYFNNKFPLEIFSSQNTKTSTKQKLTVSEANNTLVSKIVEIPAEGSLRTNLTIPAETVGIKTIKIVLEPIAEEKNTSNNSKTISIEVIDSRSKILLISDLIHPDIGFFNRILESSKDLELTIKTTEDDFDSYEYNLIILYQPQTTAERLLQDINKKGLNSFIIGGSHTDYSLLNRSELGFQKELVASNEDYSSFLNIDFSLFQVNDLDFNNFPPLVDQFGALNLTDNYSTLLEKKINGLKIDTPQWIFKTSNNQKTSILFGENIWRWRSSYYLEHSSFKNFDQTFQKIIQFLAQSKTKNTLVVDVDPLINSGEDKNLSLSYYNSNFESDTRFNFDIELFNEDSNTRENLRLIKLKDAYTLNLSQLGPGNYSYKISSQDVELSKAGNFQVLEYSNELQFENSNLNKLQKLVDIENLYLFKDREEFIDNLIANKPKPIQKSIKKTKSLIDIEWLILLLALTLSIEWFYRKYKGLI
ncbi:hypothetical protein [Psychroflexus tropicus]|uniref:hypothetical protein n=1 Tax=Psychroflexus tropicus TaxID=197345 RepID=UPI0003736912|nr:hypothetical protein [Psychroflexus tropicus]